MYLTDGTELYEIVHIDVARNAGLSGGLLRRVTVRCARDDDGPTWVLSDFALLFFEVVG